ncbi:MAG: hypothetical protein ABI075_02420 [Burkholderiaceae bacterium]
MTHDSLPLLVKARLVVFGTTRFSAIYGLSATYQSKLRAVLHFQGFIATPQERLATQELCRQYAYAAHPVAVSGMY